MESLGCYLRSSLVEDNLKKQVVNGFCSRPFSLVNVATMELKPIIYKASLDVRKQSYFRETMGPLGLNLST